MNGPCRFAPGAKWKAMRPASHQTLDRVGGRSARAEEWGAQMAQRGRGIAQSA